MPSPPNKQALSDLALRLKASAPLLSLSLTHSLLSFIHVSAPFSLVGLFLFCAFLYALTHASGPSFTAVFHSFCAFSHNFDPFFYPFSFRFYLA